MAEIMRVRARWSGFTGGPGYSVFHFETFGDENAAAALTAATRVRAFFDALKGLFPNIMAVLVDPEVEVIEDSTGTLIRSYTVAPPAIVNGTAAAVYSAATGAVVNWRTGTIRNGRRLRGRTFLVPLVGTAFGSTGQLLAATVATIQSAAVALSDTAGSTDLIVYGRPTSTGAADGTFGVVTNVNVPPMGAILTSRRD